LTDASVRECKGDIAELRPVRHCSPGQINKALCFP
jgi:hypothetical protein